MVSYCSKQLTRYHIAANNQQLTWYHIAANNLRQPRYEELKSRKIVRVVSRMLHRTEETLTVPYLSII